MRSGIKRTIKQQEEITSTFSNTYSKPNFQREKKDSNYLETSDIKDIFRTVFILPKPEYEDKIQQVYEEFDDLRKKRFNYIKEYQCKNVEKNIVLNYLLNSRNLIKL